nr:nuclear receptor coactivator 6 [Ciona intestinalis]|eukprot:XP_009860299.2 nuclear receptor coactivator 6 [Ciona intestinalis]
MNVELVYDGNFGDESLGSEIEDLKCRLSEVVGSKIVLKQVEPWNSVKVTFSIPREAAEKLIKLAANNSNELSELGVLSVQVEGKELIKLSIDIGEGKTQQVVIHQHTDNSTNSVLQKANQLLNTQVHGAMAPQQQHTSLSEVPSNPPIKKRARKSKDKQAPKQKSVAKSDLEYRFNNQNYSQNFVSLSSEESPNTVHQFPQTNPQLSPSVEQMVSEAWDQKIQHQHMHSQSAEADIMDIQLQSLLSSSSTSGITAATNITPHSIPSYGHASHQCRTVVNQDNSSFSNSAEINVVHQTNNQNAVTHKQHSLPANFAQSSNHQTSTKMFYPQSLMQQGSGNHFMSDPGQFNRALVTPELGNSDPSNNLRFHTTDSYGSMIHSSQHIPIITSTSGNWSQGTVVSATASSYKVPTTNTAEQHMLQSPGPNHSSFPLTISNQSSSKIIPQNISVEEMKQEKGQNHQGMSMASPLLVTLLQTEACTTGLSAIQTLAHTTVAGENQSKPKRKKPNRKKKPKSSALTMPTGSTVQAGGVMLSPPEDLANMSGVEGHAIPYLNQRFNQFKVQGAEHAMHQNMSSTVMHNMASISKQNYHDPKISVIETISRSDVGARSMPYSGNITNPHEASQRSQVTGQILYQRQNPASNAWYSVFST